MFTAMPQPVPLASLQLPGNHARVSTIVRGHTPLSHASSAHPWRRRQVPPARAVQEQFTLRRARRRPRVARRASSIPPGAAAPQATAPTVRRRWPWVVVAYAHTMEELAARRPGLPARSWSEPQALVLSSACSWPSWPAWWALRAELEDAARILKLGGLATPMLALPAFC
ncbi:MAG: hypothetical protein U1E71_05490 [Ramlibacter sp.]